MIEQNHECYVSLEVAKLLKEAGFDWEIFDGYIMYGDDHGFTTKFQTTYNFNGENKDLFANYGGYKEVISKPTLDVAQRWLREVKTIFIEVQIFSDSNINGVRYGVNIENSSIATPELYNTYEEAQEAGIKKALEIILEKGE